MLFQGHYHGHFEEGLVDLDDGAAARRTSAACPRASPAGCGIAQFNDPDSLARGARARRRRDRPHRAGDDERRAPAAARRPGWHDALRARAPARPARSSRSTRPTRTWSASSGATGRFGLEPDVVTIGKAVAGGIPMGAYGMTPALADELDAASATSRPAARCSATRCRRPRRRPRSPRSSPPRPTRTRAPSAPTLADGIEAAIAEAALPWTTIRFGPRSGQWYGPQPRTGADAFALTDMDLLTALLRVWMANRGVWEALPGAGPTVPIPATEADVAPTSRPTASSWRNSRDRPRLGAP